ncbi:MAG: hypothetical protein Q8L14_40975 [Myxococcales bacterium]|nr:hypothetical protein [Myxococcales bacterium]
MDTFLLRYLVSWVAFCTLALVLFVRDVKVDWRGQLKVLFVPWRVAVFLPAIVFVTVAGRYTNDETWDVVCGGGMSVLTVVTSGWSVGTLARVLRRDVGFSHAIVALALGLFSSSWFYDGYLLWRDGAYTHRWLGNLQLSPIIYACAGLLMNLELRSGRLTFAFSRADWPTPRSEELSWKLVAAAVPLMLVAAYVLIAFVSWTMPQ